MRRSILFSLSSLAAFLIYLAPTYGSGSDSPHEELNTPDNTSLRTQFDTINLCEKYLSTAATGRGELSKQIEKYDGSVQVVINALAKRRPKNWSKKTGRLFDKQFSAPGLIDQYRDDKINFYVPDSYSPDQPFGLLIFMHGGGPGTKREAAQSVLSDPELDRYSYGLQQYFTKAPFIVVAPSAIWNEKSTVRWNLPETDDYIAAVIRECHYRFNLDRDRIFLGGQSMGGFGAYHLCLRLGDRIAGGVLYAGAWRLCNWKCAIGTPLFIRHGANDAVAPGTPNKNGRPRYTDVFFARSAHQLLTSAGAEHVYAEDSGGHSIREAGESLKQLVKWMGAQRRNPFAPRVVAMTPRGWDARNDTPTPHQRWISIHAIGDQTLQFDEVVRTGPGPRWKETRVAFDQQGFAMKKRDVQAGLVDATNHGDNKMTITTHNVKNFSVWFHPAMVDFRKPVQIVLNGRESTHTLKSSLLKAIQSYERREDWGLVYHAEITLNGDAPSEK